MKQFLNRRLLAWVVATVLLAAMVLGATSCGKTSGGESTDAGIGTVEIPPENVVGEGQTTFTLMVTHLDGTVKGFTVKTDAKTVGEALVSVGLISGENSTYGLYVKTVDGEFLDYDTHQKYWAFYINGEMAMSGIDTTEITEGAVYALRAE
jgi:hypothetical protein